MDRLFATPRIIARLAASGDGPVALRRLTEELARDPALRDEVCGSIRYAVEATAAQFAEAQAEGTIRADLDPDQMAETAVGGFIGAQALTDQLGDARAGRARRGVGALRAQRDWRSGRRRRRRIARRGISCRMT